MESLSVEFLGVEYVDLTQAIPDDLFCDNLHLTADGYRRLAERLWSEILRYGEASSPAPRPQAH